MAYHLVSIVIMEVTMCCWTSLWSKRGKGRGSFIAGPSPRNQRTKCLWKGVQMWSLPLLWCTLPSFHFNTYCLCIQFLIAYKLLTCFPLLQWSVRISKHVQPRYCLIWLDDQQSLVNFVLEIKLMCQIIFIIGSHRKKSRDWTDNNRNGLRKWTTCMILGPDHFEPDTRYRIVASHTQPLYKYNNQNWEKQFGGKGTFNSQALKNIWAMQKDSEAIYHTSS